jgi:hypothetical protein
MYVSKNIRGPSAMLRSFNDNDKASNDVFLAKLVPNSSMGIFSGIAENDNLFRFSFWQRSFQSTADRLEEDPIM